MLVDAAAGGAHVGFYDEAQAHLVQVLQAPVIRQLSQATFGQLLTTLSVEQGDSQAFSPERVDPAHRHRLLAINSTHGNLEAFAGEQLAANGAIDEVDRRLASIAAPAIVIQGGADKLVAPAHGRALAAALPGARLEIVSGGHMAPYTHPALVAQAVLALAAAASSASPPSSAAGNAPSRR